MEIALFKPQCIFETGTRNNQEDALFPEAGKATEDDFLFMVCDGMGGHEHGEVASATVCSAMSSYFKQHFNKSKTVSEDDFKAALKEAYDRLDMKDHSESLHRMGTTMAMICFHEGGCLVANIGDSRIYHIRPSDPHRILFMSHDHSLVYEMYERGELSYEEMIASPQKNIITRCIMPHLPYRSEADITHITDIQAGDYFFVCSDGMLEDIDNNQLLDLVCDSHSTDEEKCIRLQEASRFSHDNHSAYLIHVKEIR
jgi:protein phosphatase